MTTRAKKMVEERQKMAEEQQKYFASLIQPLVTNEGLCKMFDDFKKYILSKLEEKIAQQDKKIEMLESALELKDKTIENLLIKCDDNEQYSRRSCLRVNGLVFDEKKDENVEDLVENCFKELDLPLDKNCIDRAHRIGKVFIDDSGKKTKQVIVKFRSWVPRVNFFKSRPRFVNNKKPDKSFSVSLDLTKRRYELLKFAKGVIKDYPSISFAFADINCSLGFKTNDNNFYYFNDQTQFEKSLSKFKKAIKI